MFCMGVNPGLIRPEKNMDRERLKRRSLNYISTTVMKWQEAGRNRVMRRSIIYALRRVLFVL